MNGPFAAEQSRGTKSPYWRANDALGHVKESHQIWIFFVQHVPVRHLLSSMAILYHVIAQLQKAHLWLSWIDNLLWIHYYPEFRRLCLRICGSRENEEIKNYIRELGSNLEFLLASNRFFPFHHWGWRHRLLSKYIFIEVHHRISLLKSSA